MQLNQHVLTTTYQGMKPRDTKKRQIGKSLNKKLKINGKTNKNLCVLTHTIEAGNCRRCGS